MSPTIRVRLVIGLSAMCVALTMQTTHAYAAGGGGGAQPPAQPPAAPKCIFTPVQPSEGLLAGAERDAVMWITSSTDDSGPTSCSQKLIGKHVTLKVANNTLAAHVERPSTSCNCTAIVHIDGETPATAVESTPWQMTDAAGGDLGTLTFGIVKISVHKLVVAVNETERSANKQIDRLPASDGTLVAASRDFVKGRKNPIVDNVAILDTPPALAGPSTAFEWHLTHATWDTSAWFHCRDDQPPQIEPADKYLENDHVHVTSAGEWSVASDKCTLHADRVVFAATRTFGSPLVVTLELRSKSDPTTTFARVHVQLATSAAAASIPIPLSQVAHLTCLLDRLGRDSLEKEAWAGQTIAIDKDALAERKCTFTIDYTFDRLHTDDAKPPAITKDDWTYLKQRGDIQAISVTVTRGTATATADYVVDPSSDSPFGLSLPVPVAPSGSGSGSDPSSNSGDYIVNIKLKSTLGVTYLENTLDPNVTSDSNTNVSFTLHTRGFGSVTYPVRFGVTFPVTPFSLRFPPRRDEVTSSTSSTRVAVETLRLSAMLFLDYWDYEHERNKLPIPLQLQAGLSAVRVGDNTSHLTALAGLALTLPVFGSGATTTSLSLGAFREWGLQESDEGWVATFSLDLFQPVKTSGTN